MLRVRFRDTERSKLRKESRFDRLIITRQKNVRTGIFTGMVVGVLKEVLPCSERNTVI